MANVKENPILELKDCKIVNFKLVKIHEMTQEFTITFNKYDKYGVLADYFRAELLDFDINKFMAFFLNRDFSELTAVEFCEQFVNYFIYDITLQRGTCRYGCYYKDGVYYFTWWTDVKLKFASDRKLNRVKMESEDFFVFESNMFDYERKKQVVEKYFPENA